MNKERKTKIATAAIVLGTLIFSVGCSSNQPERTPTQHMMRLGNGKQMMDNTTMMTQPRMMNGQYKRQNPMGSNGMMNRQN